MVFCDLILIAKKTPEHKATMSIYKLSHKFFINSLSKCNQARVKALLLCADALVSGNELSLTAIGRNLLGKAKTKHKIKRVDRLLCNKKLHHELPAYYRAISQRIIKQLPTLVIAIDWSGCCRKDIQLLRASIVFDGRSLPLLNMVVKESQYNHHPTHQQFLKKLHDIIGSSKPTYIVTDAGFKTPWFQSVKGFGWEFVGRVRGNMQAQLASSDWEPVQQLFEKASRHPSSLGKGILTKTQKTQCDAYFHVFKGSAKGRHKIRGKAKQLYPAEEKRFKKLAKEPWLLVTSDAQLSSRQIVNMYAKRMQIELNFRDDKSQRYGFSWRHSMTACENRINVLCLICFIATVLLWLVGVESEKRKLHYAFQANSIKHRRVLSFLSLAKSIVKQEPKRITLSLLKSAMKTFAIDYKKMVLE